MTAVPDWPGTLVDAGIQRACEARPEDIDIGHYGVNVQSTVIYRQAAWQIGHVVMANPRHCLRLEPVRQGREKAGHPRECRRELEIILAGPL